MRNFFFGSVSIELTLECSSVGRLFCLTASTKSAMSLLGARMEIAHGSSTIRRTSKRQKTGCV